MTYYEELGISADASAEEIRQAHRRLVKLLHPDQHQDDEQLRRLAEIQLTRVNAMVAELLDPIARQAYDVRLSHPPAPAPAPEPARLPVYRWAACVISGLALVALLGVRSPTDTVRSASGSTAGAPPEAQTEKAASARKGMPPPRSGRAVVDSPVEGSAAQSADAAVTPPAPASNDPHPATSSVPAVPASRDGPKKEGNPSPQPQSPPASLSGTWLYAGGQASERDKDLYRPEYIELRIREEGGVVRGDYRGRYRVTDLAIPPSVNFTFEGKPESADGSLPWRGPGGSSGTLSIRQLHRNAIQVDWKVTDFGTNGAGLEFGTATLVRRL